MILLEKQFDMKNFIFKFILIIFLVAGAMNVFAVSTKKVSPKKEIIYQVPVLVYHSFGSAPLKKESWMRMHYRVTAEAFQSQMKYLSDDGYHPISFSTYVNSLKDNTKLPDKAVVLTFDDGWVSQYNYAVPILEKYKFTATFFVITDYVNNKYKAYMSWDNLKDLVKNNFEIASHTESHPILTKLDFKKLANELNGSKKILEDKLSVKVMTLAYPDYAQNQTVRDAAKLAGYVGSRAGWSNIQNSNANIYQLKSQEVVNNPNPFSSKRLPDLP